MKRIALTIFAAAFATAALGADDAAQWRRLAFKYYHGQGVTQSNARAVEYFEKAARAGDAESAYDLGKMYEYAMAGVQDDARSASWYRAAAELGHPDGQFNASIAYYKGRGVPEDRAEAAKWWTLAMAKGGALAERFRPSVESAEAKLTRGEIAEGRRRAVEFAARR